MCEVGGKVCLKLKEKMGEIHWINHLRKGNLNNHMSFDNPSRDVLGLMDFTYSNNDRLYLLGLQKSLQMVTAAMKLKDACFLERKL